jgi:hypothetical protein
MLTHMLCKSQCVLEKGTSQVKEIPYGKKSGFLLVDSAEMLIYTRKYLLKAVCVCACSNKE